MRSGTDFHSECAAESESFAGTHNAVTREHKLALIVGFSLVLVLGVLISDHFSKARQVEMAQDIQPATPTQVGATTPGSRNAAETPTIAAQPAGLPENRGTLMELPGVRSRGPQVASASPSSVLPSHLPLVDARNYAPYGENHAPVPGTIVVQPTPPAPPVVQIPLTKYDVKEGDTLYRIATKFYGDGKLWEKIRECNKDKVGSGGELKVGAILMLPPKDVLLGKPYAPPAGLTQPSTVPGTPGVTDSRTARTSTGPTALADTQTNLKDYVVKEGDTLVGIAKKLLNTGNRWPEIMAANKATLSDPESLAVGMKLRIPSR